MVKLYYFSFLELIPRILLIRNWMKSVISKRNALNTDVNCAIIAEVFGLIFRMRDTWLLESVLHVGKVGSSSFSASRTSESLDLTDWIIVNDVHIFSFTLSFLCLPYRRKGVLSPVELLQQQLPPFRIFTGTGVPLVLHFVSNPIEVDYWVRVLWLW